MCIRDRGRGEAGSVAALPIWVDYMRVGLNDVQEDTNELPDYIEEGFVNRDTGQRTDEFDPNSTPELFVIEELAPDNINDFLPNPMSEFENIEPNLDGIYEQESDSELDQPDLAPQIRIIDSSEDTEGLF